MSRPVVVWTGEAAGARWSIRVHDVYDGPLVDPIDGEIIADSHVVAWTLELVNDRGARIRGAWDATQRELTAQLHGWSTHAIGIVKRHLIAMGMRPVAG